jgi:hypothetical protein
MDFGIFVRFCGTNDTVAPWTEAWKAPWSTVDGCEILHQLIDPICSMYSIFTYIWAIYRVNVGKYSIHGAYGSIINYL